ncbi:MAG: hypothetical protein AAF418_06605 [Pseudomonadota bacterium]
MNKRLSKLHERFSFIGTPEVEPEVEDVADYIRKTADQLSMQGVSDQHSARQHTGNS